jgi:chorismate synthase
MEHDPCVVPRAVPIVEAMASIVVMDEMLIQHSRTTAAGLLPPITTLPHTMVMPPRDVLLNQVRTTIHKLISRG